MKKTLTILSLLFCFQLFSQEKYSNEFLSIGVGAREMGMGNVAVATTNDVFSSYWNPAGLTAIDKNIQLGGMHAEYFAGISNYEFIGLGINASEKSALAFSYIRLSTDNIPNTTALIDENGVPRYDRISSFSASDNAIYISYAKELKYFTMGGNVKIIFRKAGEFAKAWGFGLDLSFLYKKNNISIGLMLQDITTTVNSWSYNTSEFEDVFILTGNDIPVSSTEVTLPKIIPGIAYEYNITDDIHLLGGLDLQCTFDGERNTLIHSSWINIDPRLGMQFDYKKIVFIRAGLHNMQKIAGYDNKENYSVSFNLGAGFHFWNFTLDYSYTNIGNQSLGLNSHIISLKYDIESKYKK